MTPGTTLHFGSLGFVYTGPVESVAGRTFGWLPRPNVLTRAAMCEAFVRSLSGDVVIGMLRPNPMQERFRLTAYYLTDLAFPGQQRRTAGLEGVHGAVHRNVPPWTPSLPVDPVTAYVNGLRTASVAPGCMTTRGARTA
jgi:hypothetical protein